MKNRFFVIVVFVTFLMSSNSLAALKDVTINWTMPTPENVTDYKMYFSYNQDLSPRTGPVICGTATQQPDNSFQITCNDVDLDITQYPVYFIIVADVGDEDFESAPYIVSRNKIVTGFTMTIPGANTPPTPAISAAPTTGSTPLTVNFSAQNSTDQDGSITAFVWNFGNNNYANTSSANFTFTEIGTFPVSLTVTDDDGATSIAQINVLTTEPGLSTSIEVRISNGEDDAEEALSSGWTSTTSSDLELGVDGSVGAQLIGLRFRNIDIPQGAQIINAYIEFEVDETNSSSSNLTIQGENASNSIPFSGYDFNISTRQTTTASVQWDNLASWNTINEKQVTPDISAVLQEIINITSWAPGNALSILISGNGLRTAEAYDGEIHAAPIIHITY